MAKTGSYRKLVNNSSDDSVKKGAEGFSPRLSGCTKSLDKHGGALWLPTGRRRASSGAPVGTPVLCCHLALMAVKESDWPMHCDRQIIHPISSSVFSDGVSSF